MNRYFYYNIALVSSLNLMLFVPYLLIHDRYEGAVSSMVCATFAGTALAFLYSHVMKVFPGKGMPEILSLFLPKFISVPILLFMSLMWLMASSIALAGYAVLINRFFNPDTSSMIVLMLLAGVCIYTSTRSTLTVMFVIEMAMIVNLPIVLFILFKASTSSNLDWDAIRAVAQYWKVPPKFEPFAASIYVFTGYTNYAVFNRLNPHNFRIRYRWLIPLICFLVLLISFFVPIGFHGTEAVASYLYIWSVTSDSLMLGYGFIERVIFLFLLLFLNLTIVYTTTGWHIAMEMVKSCMPRMKPQIDPARTPKANWFIASAFALATLAASYFLNEKQNLTITQYWLMLRVYVEVVMVFLLFFFSLRAGRKKLGT
ncbi:GerAB/ArcD/ProY family transporter [Paenibacillus silvisoli]|uniref:GerAB/ArcD/ProY family transporter n=1 Tax=Paenibacillus silvisoli TaxID=3110539 RepID=UPI002803F22B|nr:GerAB/ArcD/ProY family transporter [Paenibacillus silvisoli]